MVPLIVIAKKFSIRLNNFKQCALIGEQFDIIIITLKFIAEAFPVRFVG